jgi:hypothetical protein
VGWCQLTPRDALPWLDRAWRLKRVDVVPVWSLSCFYVRKGYRKRASISWGGQPGLTTVPRHLMSLRPTHCLGGKVNRRVFLRGTMSSACTAARLVEAKQAGRMPRIGWLGGPTRESAGATSYSAGLPPWCFSNVVPEGETSDVELNLAPSPVTRNALHEELVLRDRLIAGVAGLTITGPAPVHATLRVTFEERRG